MSEGGENSGTRAPLLIPPPANKALGCSAGRHAPARVLVKMLVSPVLSAAVLPLTNFTCRRRDMLLTPDEAALALRGSIAPSLRQRSSSYYWHAVSRDKQAKHEAICTKRVGWHLRTFGSHANWALAAEEKCGAKVGVAKLVRRGTLKHTCVASLWHAWFSPRHMRLQSLAHTVAGAERRARLVRCSTARGPAGQLRC